jgi:hypothetical protein
VPAMFDSVVSLDLINGSGTNRTKPNMNPPMAVPYYGSGHLNPAFSGTGRIFSYAASHGSWMPRSVASGYPLLSCLRNVAKLKNV